MRKLLVFWRVNFLTRVHSLEWHTCILVACHINLMSLLWKEQNPFFINKNTIYMSKFTGQCLCWHDIYCFCVVWFMASLQRRKLKQDLNPLWHAFLVEQWRIVKLSLFYYGYRSFTDRCTQQWYTDSFPMNNRKVRLLGKFEPVSDAKKIW